MAAEPAKEIAPGASEELDRALPMRTATRLAGRRKAAVLMAALGPERAAEVMQHMREEEIEGLSLEMAKMGSIEEETTEAILGELAQATRARRRAGRRAAGIEFAREVIERALGAGARRAELLGRLAGP